ncbi:MAG: ABC transporter permease [Acidobacteriota bacterium]
MASLLPDLRFAAKSLARTPGFTLIAVVTLGLGIGANTSMFTTIDGYMLRPSPYPGSDRVDRIYRATPDNARGGIPPADYLDLRSEIDGYGEIAAYADWDMNVAEPGKPATKADGGRISANLFSMLGTEPLIGRGFRPDEELPGNHRVLVINYRYWKNRFGGDPGIVGRTVRIDGEPYEVVGVLPASFSDWRHLDGIDLYRPLGLDEKERRDRGTPWLRLVGRRAPGVGLAQGDAMIASFGRGLAAAYPASNADVAWRTVSIQQSFLPRTGVVMMSMLVGLSGFVLLIACSNLANLLLARTMARAREFAVRAALGASRAQVLRPLIFEAVLLTAAGGVAALLFAQWTYDWMNVASKADNGVGVDFGFDGRVLLWAFGASLFTVVAFGVAPALFVERLDLNAILKSGGRGTTGSRGHQRFRNALVVGQSALAMVLLAGAALFARGLHELHNRRHGWESSNLVTGTVALPVTTYRDDREIAEFHRLVVERLEALPGVATASISCAMPHLGFGDVRKYVVAGVDPPSPGREPVALVNGVSPHYFETVGTTVLQGRAFNASDAARAARVFIVNEAVARGLFGGASPIGRRIGEIASDGTPPAWGEVVGVVADVESVQESPSPVVYQIYHPLLQEPRRTADVAVRSRGVAPSALVDAIRSTMMALDPDLPVQKLQPAETTIVRSNYGLGVLRTLLVSLALLGLGLAALGTYGVNARAVAQREREFGIRLALGAHGGDIVRLVLSSGAKLALVGSALGLAGAIVVSRLFLIGFPGMRVDSVPAVAGAAALLMAIALAACYVPARRASRTSPSDTLRAE